MHTGACTRAAKRKQLALRGWYLSIIFKRGQRPRLCHSKYHCRTVSLFVILFNPFTASFLLIIPNPDVPYEKKVLNQYPVVVFPK